MKEIIITKNGKEDEIKLLKDAISKKRGTATKLNDCGGRESLDQF